MAADAAIGNGECSASAGGNDSEILIEFLLHSQHSMIVACKADFRSPVDLLLSLFIR